MTPAEHMAMQLMRAIAASYARPGVVHVIQTEIPAQRTEPKQLNPQERARIEAGQKKPTK